MTAVLFCMAMIIEIVYVFMSPVPKELENKYLLIGTAFICAADFTYHTEYITIKMYVLALLGSVATLIFLISCAVGVITKCIDFEDLFFSLFMELFLPLLTMLLTKSYELMIFVIIAVVGLGMIKIFMAHKEKNNRQERGFLRITINGKTITCSGINIVISNGKVIVDGKTIQECNSGDIKVTIEGDVNKIDCDGSVEVHGNSGSIDCGGSCEVSGDVKGDIDAGGSVTCGNVSGDIDAGGSVRCRR